MFIMKKIFLPVIMIYLALRCPAQGTDVVASIDSINSMLKANPYYDGFNEISFFYSVNITIEKDFVVEMNFDGPFKWVYKVKISDLDLSAKNDPCKESPSSICWNCIKTSSGEPGSMVVAEMILADGGSQKENASNICVSFSGRAGICNDLKKRLERLFFIINSDL